MSKSKYSYPIGTAGQCDFFSVAVVIAVLIQSVQIHCSGTLHKLIEQRQGALNPVYPKVNRATPALNNTIKIK